MATAEVPVSRNLPVEENIRFDDVLVTTLKELFVVIAPFTVVVPFVELYVPAFVADCTFKVPAMVAVLPLPEKPNVIAPAALPAILRVEPEATLNAVDALVSVNVFDALAAVNVTAVLPLTINEVNVVVGTLETVTVAPLLKVTLSPVPGTPFGVQLVAVAQELLEALFQT